MRIDTSRLRARAFNGAANGRAASAAPAGPTGANPTMPTSRAYRDDLPEQYRDRLWCKDLESDPSAIDELKRTAGYAEPAGSGRWGTPQRHAIARWLDARFDQSTTVDPHFAARVRRDRSAVLNERHAMPLRRHVEIGA